MSNPPYPLLVTFILIVSVPPNWQQEKKFSFIMCDKFSLSPGSPRLKTERNRDMLFQTRKSLSESIGI
jgi:hypothetical protein